MPLVAEVLGQALAPMVPHSVLKSLVSTLDIPAHAEVGSLDMVSAQRVLAQLGVSLKLYTGQARREQLDSLRKLVTGSRHPAPTSVKITIVGESDVLVLVKACQGLCKGFFNGTDSVRLATVVSELARNIYMYAGTGSIELTLAEDDLGAQLRIRAVDSGPGFLVERVMAERYESKTGLGRGLKGCRAILDDLSVVSAPGRTQIVGTKRVRR
jgi:serine/threonine-protein kinase RsbT